MDLPFFPGHRTATKAVQSFARRPVPALLHPIGFSSISVSKPHSYVLASLLMALASLHPLISETRDRSGSIPFVSHILMCLFHCSWLSHLHIH